VLIVRFKARCLPGKTEEVREAMTAIIAPSRAMSGVINFDFGRDITDPDSFIATEVYEDRAAMDRQEAQPEVAKLLDLIGAGAFAGPPEWTIFEVVSAESPEM
jgi:quinol monooxygenase YgiN